MANWPVVFSGDNAVTLAPFRKKNLTGLHLLARFLLFLSKPYSISHGCIYKIEEEKITTCY